MNATATGPAGRLGCSGRSLRGFVALIALVMTMLVAAALGGAATAWAHSSLISSSPAADSVLTQPPDRVELVFNEEIRDFQPRIAITVGDGDPVEVTPTVDGATVRADLTGLGLPVATGGEPVAWKIGYRVVSADGHPVSGLVPFSVGDGPASSADAAGPTGAAAPDSASDGASGIDGWWWVAGLVAVLAVAAAGWMVIRRRQSDDAPAGR